MSPKKTRHPSRPQKKARDPLLLPMVFVSLLVATGVMLASTDGLLTAQVFSPLAPNPFDPNSLAHCLRQVPKGSQNGSLQYIPRPECDNLDRYERSKLCPACEHFSSRALCAYTARPCIYNEDRFEQCHALFDALQLVDAGGDRSFFMATNGGTFYIYPVNINDPKGRANYLKGFSMPECKEKTYVKPKDKNANDYISLPSVSGNGVILHIERRFGTPMSASVGKLYLIDRKTGKKKLIIPKAPIHSGETAMISYDGKKVVFTATWVDLDNDPSTSFANKDKGTEAYIWQNGLITQLTNLPKAEPDAGHAAVKDTRFEDNEGRFISMILTYDLETYTLPNDPTFPYPWSYLHLYDTKTRKFHKIQEGFANGAFGWNGHSAVQRTMHQILKDEKGANNKIP